MPNLETVIISHTIIVSHITLFRQSTYLALKQVAKSGLSNYVYFHKFIYSQGEFIVDNEIYLISHLIGTILTDPWIAYSETLKAHSKV